MKYAERVLDLAPETPDAYICRLLARTQTACADESGLVNLGDPADGYSEFDKALRFSAGAYHKKLLDLRDQQTARLYDLLSTRASNQHFPAEMNRLANRLRALNGYSDSAALAEAARRRRRDLPPAGSAEADAQGRRRKGAQARGREGGRGRPPGRRGKEAAGAGGPPAPA
jgi:hypothetical protein